MREQSAMAEGPVSKGPPSNAPSSNTHSAADSEIKAVLGKLCQELQEMRAEFNDKLDAIQPRRCQDMSKLSASSGMQQKATDTLPVIPDKALGSMQPEKPVLGGMAPASELSSLLRQLDNMVEVLATSEQELCAMK